MPAGEMPVPALRRVTSGDLLVATGTRRRIPLATSQSQLLSGLNKKKKDKSARG